MEAEMQAYFNDLHSEDKNAQYEAFNQIMMAAKEKVDWAYEVWDGLKDDLTHRDNHRRARAGQFLSYLAISDPEKRMLKDFPAVWEVTKDKKFVTARHTLQAIWRIALAGPEQKEMVLQHISDRFIHGADEKNYTLIRFDMIQGLRNFYDETKEEDVRQIALDLIEKEEDPKYKKKYAGVWKNA
ncbi:hypothetical protein J7I93_00710 [Bacillus sp. ISL-47]|uniref:hypothetical protein n=1 Tax=Bacillus sp. ISL-47 TaxID=2819130 RepID=UPI001BE95032|nr:hypothetical protein [Bacillus sp. ISL-47]MBT2686695.1 hypothetical protein [Bacillus sp. ISL-47]MBT2707090.1 hypothetical protein [Pseudomonas sp. ISL-84]